MSCQHDFSSLILDISCNCPLPSHCGISTLEPWDEANLYLLWDLDSVGLPLKWHLTKHHLQGHNRSMDWSHLPTVVGHSIHYSFPLVCFSVEVSVVSFPHCVSLDSILLSLCELGARWKCDVSFSFFGFSVDSNFLFRSFLDPRDPPPSFFPQVVIFNCLDFKSKRHFVSVCHLLRSHLFLYYCELDWN